MRGTNGVGGAAWVEGRERRSSRVLYEKLCKRLMRTTTTDAPTAAGGDNDDTTIHCRIDDAVAMMRLHTCTDFLIASAAATDHRRCCCSRRLRRATAVPISDCLAEIETSQPGLPGFARRNLRCSLCARHDSSVTPALGSAADDASMAPPGTISMSPQDAAGDPAPARPMKAARIATDVTERGAKEAALEPWRSNLRGGAIEASLTLPRPASWWTGPNPHECPGFCRDTGTLTSLPLPVRVRERKAKDAHVPNAHGPQRTWEPQWLVPSLSPLSAEHCHRDSRGDYGILLQHVVPDRSALQLAPRR